MSAHVECYFTPISPWAYLGMARFRRIVANTRVSASWKPVDISRVFATVGAVPVGKRPQSKQANRLQELERWRDYLGLPLNLQPKFFPVDPDPACRLIAAAILQGEDGAALSEACLKAVWSEERDLSDVATLASIADECGLNGSQLTSLSDQPEAQILIDRYTDQAISKGVIGSPCYVIDDQVYFGQDRLDFVERALQL
ncbi:2-hydroxychromene-2-carboxylate isomerase [Motiliproteus sp. MSK22-1]|uniref:2-hydroxychromene-2-carboxylate isomerase n=1 Tax=Motiliproteus sp. MSK22-1 TaxID=1897630 RepID=UPI0009755DD2|nr:2-hydroxychromene-2-carboxylate isomerase [Motiliproteus sp. MSK22-1]OMH38207.1 hypothetical protein BGP75_08110 [Motiliproteus sp. MSK22-1]